MKISSWLKRAEQKDKRESGDQYRRINVPADKVSNQKQNQPCSPSPHLWADRSIPEDAEDAEDAEKRSLSGYVWA